MCIICREKGIAGKDDDISSTILWLVEGSKNISFIRDVKKTNYSKNIAICEKCCTRLKAALTSKCSDVLDMNERYYKFGKEEEEEQNLYIKVFFFSSKYIEDKEGIRSFGNRLNNLYSSNNLLQSFRNFKENVIKESEFLKTEDLTERVFFDLIIYRLQKKKVDVVSYIEDIRLSDISFLIDVQDRFNEIQKEKRRDKHYYEVDIFSGFEIRKKDENGNFNPSFLDFIDSNKKLEIFRKILKFQEFSEEEEKYLTYVIKKKIRESLYKENFVEDKISHIFIFLEFLYFLDQNLREKKGKRILKDDSSLRILGFFSERYK